MAAMMTPERWQQVTDTLNKVLDLPAFERATCLSEIAACDPELYREVASLLDAHDNAGAEFLSMPAMQSLPDLIAQPIAEALPETQRDTMIGRRLGSYQIVEQIGEGGMGAVYRAFRADDQYRKQVALKVIRGGEGSGFVVSRFRNERQILASLDHPNIARLLDGGTTEEGAPYFVMELIEGENLVHYCDHHQLPSSERMRLFLQVCAAVQFAHQRLIIHRDIKPGNILVTTDGTPKLLDFGIAKILDADAAPGQFEPTMTLFRLLTPGYASPEQIRGDTITTAADVYSLGVVLYELLTGSHPHRMPGDTPQQIAKAVCEIEPRRPSTVVRRAEPVAVERSSTNSGAARPAAPTNHRRAGKMLSGDLDNIILMALRKEPQRRYVSVEQFAEDIRRHLANLPVVARKDTVGYRASKFITRHKAAVAAALIVTLTLFAGLAVTLYEAHVARVQAAIAREQRARAERRFNDVRKLANSMMFEIHDSIANLPGATQARKLLVGRAVEYLDSLSQEAGGDASLQRELAAAYDRVGDVLGYTGAANLGDYAGASESYAKALAIRESLAAANPADLALQTELADEYFRVAGVQQSTGDFDDALKTLQRALPFMQRDESEAHDPKLGDRIAGLYYYTGTVLEKKGDFAGALQNYRRSTAIREPIAGPGANLIPRAHLVADYNGLAKMLAKTGQLDDAILTAEKALASIRQLSDANPANATLREWVGESYLIDAGLQLDKGDTERALTFDREAQEIFIELRSADTHNRLAADNLGFCDLAIGEILVRRGKIDQGLQSEREGLAVFQTGNSKTLWNTTGVTDSYYDFAAAYLAQGDSIKSPGGKIQKWREARSWFQRAHEVWIERPNRAGSDALGRDQGARISEGLAKCDAKLRELTASMRTQSP
jgi:eukaryotic-like serine/threonine-protein kinase